MRDVLANHEERKVTKIRSRCVVIDNCFAPPEGRCVRTDHIQLNDSASVLPQDLQNVPFASILGRHAADSGRASAAGIRRRNRKRRLATSPICPSRWLRDDSGERMLVSLRREQHGGLWDLRLLNVLRLWFTRQAWAIAWVWMPAIGWLFTLRHGAFSPAGGRRTITRLYVSHWKRWRTDAKRTRMRHARSYPI